MGFVVPMVVSLFTLAPTSAKDIVFDPVNSGLLTQSDFDNFITEFGTAISFLALTPAKTLGVVGFDVSVEVAVTDINHNANYWKFLVEGNDTTNYLPIPRLHVQKGLPGKIDIGGMVAAVPGSNIRVWGGEIKYGVVKGNAFMPAVTTRASFSQLDGVDDIDLETYSLDLLISKRFLMITPYGGVSALHIEGRETSPLVTGLNDVKEDVMRLLLGLQLYPFPYCDVTVEAAFGDVPQYGLKAGFRF
ncbi:MAG: hypothetical protein IIA65_04020 [Planctomycetes bacterium]|nr:hypothetical protein [Planctomycetota bacterium]